jgi:hypothetical protein
MTHVLALVIGMKIGYLFALWWIRPDIKELRNQVETCKETK